LDNQTGFLLEASISENLRSIQIFGPEAKQHKIQDNFPLSKITIYENDSLNSVHVLPKVICGFLNGNLPAAGRKY